MIDRKICALVEKFVVPDFERLLERLQKKITHIRNNATLSGSPSSGDTVQRVRDLCGREIEERTRIVWERLHGLLVKSGIRNSDGLAQELKAEVRRYTNLILNGPSGCFKTMVIKADVSTANPLSNYYERALAQVDARIEEFVLSLSTREKSAANRAGHNIQVRGNVGVIQMASGSSAIVTLNLRAQDRERIAQALDQARSDISCCGELSAETKEPILELAEDAKKEAARDNPNILKLGLFLDGIATAIQTVSSLQPAYKTVTDAVVFLRNLWPPG